MIGRRQPSLPFDHYQSITEANDADIIRLGPEAAVAQYGDQDTIYRIARLRSERYAPADESERSKITAAWVDGFLCATRSHEQTTP
jgi:hypothetical protein